MIACQEHHTEKRRNPKPNQKFYYFVLPEAATRIRWGAIRTF